MDNLLAGSGVGAFVLLAAGWQLRSALQRRRARRRPLALVLSDAIIAGSNAPRDHETPGGDAPGLQAARRVKPEISGLEKLNEKNEWGFSLHDADKVIFTFVYQGREQALAAHKAMRRAAKDLAFMLEPTNIGPAPPSRADTRKPWELGVGLDPVTRSFASGAHSRANP